LPKLASHLGVKHDCVARRTLACAARRSRCVLLALAQPAMSQRSEIEAALAEVDLLERVRTDPVWFCEEVLNLKGDGWRLDEWQRELVQAAADPYRKLAGLPTLVNHEAHNMITVRAMHGPGKTFAVAALMHWFNCAFKGRIICTAPKERQLATRLWPAFRRISTRAGKEYSAPLDVQALKITWHGDEDWCAIAETASQPENLAGYHDDYMMVIVDEASGVSEAMFPVIEGMASTGIFVLLLLVGNPTKKQGTFFASHCVPNVARNYYRQHVSLDKTTRVSMEWVRRMEEKYGKDSPVVKIRCYGEFADSDEAQLIAYDWLTQALGRERLVDGTQRRLRITVDVADGGNDFTEVTAAEMFDTCINVLDQHEFSFPSAESPILAAQAADRIFAEHGGRKGADDIVVDSLGVGAGTAGELMRMGHAVVTYKGGESSDDPSQWRNRRTQSYIVMRDAHRDGHITYAEAFEEGWDDFAAQVCSVRGRPGQERLEELETKESMKRRNLKSPDKADGIAMLFATQAPTAPTQLEVTGFGQTDSSRSDF
jgi:phage terminase large subunit